MPKSLFALLNYLVGLRIPTLLHLDFVWTGNTCSHLAQQEIWVTNILFGGLDMVFVFRK